MSEKDRRDLALLYGRPHPELLPPAFIPAPDQPGDDDNKEQQE